MTKAGIFTAAAAALALAACGGNSGETEKQEGTAAQATQASTAPATNAATPAATQVSYAELTGDPAKGEQVFAQCRTCHTTEPGVNRVGPTLHAVVGREAGTVEGYNYSPANKNSGLTWTEETLYEYLQDPRAKVPGTKMIFAGLKNPQDRADVIAYLKTQQ